MKIYVELQAVPKKPSKKIQMRRLGRLLVTVDTEEAAYDDIKSLYWKAEYNKDYVPKCFVVARKK